MTHGTDYSYLTFAMWCSAELVYVFYIIWARDRFQVFRVWELKKLAERKAQLWKLFTIIFIMLSLLMYIIYGWMVAHVKYEEGFDVVENMCVIKNIYEMSDSHQNILNAARRVYIFRSTFLTSAGFLLMAFWHHVTARLFKMKNKEFIQTWEFKTYTIYSVVSIGLSFTLNEISYSTDEETNSILQIIVPPMFFNLEAIVIVALVQRSNCLFTAQLNKTPNKMYRKMRYLVTDWIFFNKLLSFGLSLMLISNIMFNSDIIISQIRGTPRRIYDNRFVVDVLFNSMFMGYLLTVYSITAILFPNGPSTASSFNNDRETITRPMPIAVVPTVLDGDENDSGDNYAKDSAISPKTSLLESPGVQLGELESGNMQEVFADRISNTS